MKKIVLFLTTLLLFSSCMKHDFENTGPSKEQIRENAENIFGVVFDKNHSWCTTTTGTVVINDIPSGIETVQLLVSITEEDGNTSLLKLNETAANGQTSVELKYDAPSVNNGLFAAFIAKDNYIIRPLETASAQTRRAMTRSAVSTYTLPSETPVLTGSIESYASQRGWVPGEQLWEMGSYTAQKIAVPDYSDEYKTVFRQIIFSYFKNGRKYNNLPLVKASGYYNETVYPITTGEEPIIISPVYKNDGGYQEVVNSDLYYYYFKESDVPADAVSYFESLPKYKAIPLNECIAGDDVIVKSAGYALIYWGDGQPTEGTEGSYQFPAGYKIGFMVRAKTTAEGGKKQGELYGDGRLNNNINSYSKCNLKSSNLGEDGPRAAWMTVNGRMLLCYESGTDTDFNDIIIEVEGGVEDITVIPNLPQNFYTFCFEDTQLGDYDMNDVVIRATRINDTKIEYSIVACGAFDKLLVKNINGTIINGNTEIHQMFGAPDGTYINTVKGQTAYEPVTDQVTVSKSFSFLDESTQPYIYDITTGLTVKLARVGEDPHGIMIPYEFKWPLEKVCIKNAYQLFNNWGSNPVTSTDWYKFPTEDLVY